MAVTVEQLVLAKCPVCGDPHDFTLEVRRDTIVGVTEGKSGGGKLNFTRLFTCPKEDKTFQATFSLMQAADEVIVVVSGGADFDAEFE